MPLKKASSPMKMNSLKKDILLTREKNRNFSARDILNLSITGKMMRYSSFLYRNMRAISDAYTVIRMNMSIRIHLSIKK
jgi:hypothetical protein